MNYTLLRNATALLTIGGSRFLVDPALDPAGARPPVANTPNQHPNPLVDLPPEWQQAISGVDGLVVTHLHRDHWDETAVRVLDHRLPALCQPDDAERLRAAGFRAVQPVEQAAGFGDVTITRTSGRHGTGEIGDAMAPVSGFVFAAPNDTRLYLAGDTIWCDEVAQAIVEHRPEVIVVNAGGARFLEGEPIVMTADDIARVHLVAPEALIVVVHLEAINHCIESRSYYRDRLPELGIPLDRFRIPEDGEAVIW